MTSTLEADDQAHAEARAAMAVPQQVRLPRPDAPRVLVVANQKGGVGKTTTAVNVAVSLAQGGLKVLVIDLDPQGNASTALAIDHGRDLPSIYDALVDGASLAELARPATEVENLWVVPSNVDLAGAEIELVSQVARENRLRKALDALPGLDATAEDRFDYVLVDCPPSLGLLTLNALVAAKEVLVPIQSEYYALEGVGQLLETVELVRANLNPELEISTILLTMYDARTRLSAAVADEVRTHFGDKVLNTYIPRSVRVSEAPSFSQSVIAYDPYSPGALSYLEAAREIAARGVTSANATLTAPEGIVASGSEAGPAAPREAAPGSSAVAPTEALPAQSEGESATEVVAEPAAEPAAEPTAESAAEPVAESSEQAPAEPAPQAETGGAADEDVAEAPADEVAPEGPADEVAPEAPADGVAPEAPADEVAPEGPADEVAPEGSSDGSVPESAPEVQASSDQEPQATEAPAPPAVGEQRVGPVTITVALPASATTQTVTSPVTSPAATPAAVGAPFASTPAAPEEGSA